MVVYFNFGMSSSTFEVKSESDNEKGLEYGMDVCENEIDDTNIDADPPKDHNYTKESEVLEDEELKESDNSASLEEKDAEEKATTPVKSKDAKAPKTEKAVKKATKGRPKKEITKKVPQAKKGSVVSKKVKSKKVVESDSEEDENDDISKITLATSKEDTKKPKKGTKRKVEEKENVNDQNSSSPKQVRKRKAKESPPAEKVSSPKPLKTKKSVLSKSNVAPGDTIDYDNLPKGWMRKTVVRKSGKSAGQIDIYIYSPEGVKLRSKPDVAAYLRRTKSKLSLDNFDFSRKTVNQNSAKTLQKKKPAPSPKPQTKIVKKKQPAKSPKKPKTLLVKFGSKKGKKSATVKKVQQKAAKVTKSPVKGKKVVKAASKGGKKKT